VTQLVATTHLSRAELDRAYGEALVAKTVDELRARGAQVEHQLDATRLDLGVLGEPFERIIFNFPCVASADGDVSADGQHAEMRANLELMRAFFRHAPRLLAAGGEVHVTHKTKPPFSHWRLVDLVESEEPPVELHYTGRVVFDPALYLGYAPRKVATAAGSFPTGDAVVYVWRGLAARAAGQAGESTLNPALRDADVWFDADASPLAQRCRKVAEREGVPPSGGKEIGKERAGEAKRKQGARQGPGPASLAAPEPRGAPGGRFPMSARVSGPHCVQLTAALLDLVCERSLIL